MTPAVLGHVPRGAVLLEQFDIDSLARRGSGARRLPALRP
jgi:hypothetical protein